MNKKGFFPIGKKPFHLHEKEINFWGWSESLLQGHLEQCFL